MMRKVTMLLMVVISMMMIAPVSAQGNTLADVVVSSASGASPEFTVLLAAVQAADPDAGLLGALSNPEADLTVFAPTDAAFNALLRQLGVSADQLLANTALLTTVLQYHIVPTAVSAETALSLVSSDGGDVYVPTLRFEDDILLRTVGGELYVDDARVISTDIFAHNGIVHVIDSVLLPDYDLTIAEIVIDQASSGEFTILLAAVQAADPSILALLSTREADLTVFAPTDRAFAALLNQLGVTAEELLADTALLNAVLQYHVLGTTAYSNEVVALDGGEATTVNGGKISVAVNGGVVLNGSVNVIQTDLRARNGVIHVIDSVLLP